MSLPPVREPDLSPKPKRADKEPSRPVESQTPKAVPQAEPRRPQDPALRSPLADIMGGPGQIEMDGDAAIPDDEDELDEPITGTIEGPDAEAMAAYAAATAKKGEAVWYVVVGVAMLFMASFHWGVGAGGVLMVLWGGFRYAQYANVAKHAYDPWTDSDIDAWEDVEMSP